MNNEDYRALKNAVREALIDTGAPHCPHCGFELVYEPVRATHVASCSLKDHSAHYYTPSTQNTSSGHPGSIHRHPWLKHDS